MTDWIFLLLFALVIPGLMLVPYLRTARRLYRLAAERGWQQPPLWPGPLGGPLRCVGTTMRDRHSLWSKAELGDFGPEAADLVQSMRRRQVVGTVLAIVTWVGGILLLGQVR